MMLYKHFASYKYFRKYFSNVYKKEFGLKIGIEILITMLNNKQGEGFI